MFKVLRKKLSMVLVCSIIVLFNMVPTFAAPEDYTLVDGVQSRQVVQPGGTADFFFTVNDPDQRAIRVFSSNGTVSSRIGPSGNDYFQNHIGKTSGGSNLSNMYGCHFIPGVTYLLQVTSNNPSQPATIIVDMSKGAPATLVNVGTQDVIEKNMTSGGQNEYYSLGFEQSGIYEISVSFSGDAYVTYSDATNSTYSRSYQLSKENSYKSFDVTVNTASNYNNTYLLGIINNNPSGQGNGYTVRIRRK